MKKPGKPKIGEIVIGKIVRLTPYSALVQLLEYESMGMVHISEVSSGWVKDIRHYVHEGDIIVAKVMKDDRSYLALSIKRVSKNQKAEKIKDYNLEKKAEKMFSILSKGMGGSEKVLNTMIENFGSIHKVFELSIKNTNILIKKGIPEKWAEKIKEFYQNNVKQKSFEFKAIVEVSSTDSNGIKKVKSVLISLEKFGTEIIYISSPKYLMRFHTNDPKEGEKLMEKIINKFPNLLSKYSCKGNISRI